MKRAGTKKVKQEVAELSTGHFGLLTGRLVVCSRPTVEQALFTWNSHITILFGLETPSIVNVRQSLQWGEEVKCNKIFNSNLHLRTQALPWTTSDAIFLFPVPRKSSPNVHSLTQWRTIFLSGDNALRKVNNFYTKTLISGQAHSNPLRHISTSTPRLTGVICRMSNVKCWMFDLSWRTCTERVGYESRLDNAEGTACIRCCSLANEINALMNPYSLSAWCRCYRV